MRFDTHSLYDDMFNAFNREFVQSILYPTKPEPLSRQAKLLGTAAAILMQQPGFRGEVSEEAIRSMS